MTFRPRDLLLTLATMAVLVAAVVLLVGGRQTPSLDDCRDLVRNRKWDEAQLRIEAYLRANPADAQAQLLRARVSLDRPNSDPARALAQLRTVRSDDPRTAALVHVYQGLAYYRQTRYDRAVAAWEEALRLDPTAPEAGWGLSFVYDIQGRREDAHRLILRLFETEPDPGDRVRLLLEAARQDVETVAPGSVINLFQPIHESNPDDLPSALALGLALVHDSRTEQGVDVLRDALRRHETDAAAWDGLLTGLDDATRYDEFVATVRRLPKGLAADSRFLKHQGRAAQEAGEYRCAATVYRRAWEAEPYNKVVLYRLSRVLQRLGDRDEASRYDERYRAFDAASKALGEVYRTAKETPGMGTSPHPLLYQRLAELRERMGRLDEARAWHRLVLRDDPSDPVSLAALERLKEDERLLEAAGRDVQLRRSTENDDRH